MVVLFYAAAFILAILPFLWSKRDSITFPIPAGVSKLWHILGFWIRCSTAVPLILYMFGVELQTGYLAAAYACYFSFTFDVSYNKWVYNDLWRVGITSWWDRHLGGIGFVLKPIFFFLFIGAYLFALI